MKVQEVILPTARRIGWWQAPKILGISDHGLRRSRERYHGYDSAWTISVPQPALRIGGRSSAAPRQDFRDVLAWQPRGQDYSLERARFESSHNRVSENSG